MTLPKQPPKTRWIELQGVRQNNLKNLSVRLPLRKLTVITGLSGSGKSSLAFDTLYAEGQRRYIESLSTYTRQFLDKMPKPELDFVRNIPPAIALEQRNSVLNSRSTVGSQTEIVDYLRLFYAAIGQTYCLQCGTEVIPVSAESILDWAKKNLVGKKTLILASFPIQKKTPFAKLLPLLLEQGYRRIYFEGETLSLEEPLPQALSKQSLPAVQIVVDRIKMPEVSDPETDTRLLEAIENALHIGQNQVTFIQLENNKSAKTFDTRFACPACAHEHPRPEPSLFSSSSPLGACPTCNGFGHTLELAENKVVPDPSKTLKNGAIDPFSKPSLADEQKKLFRFAEKHGISVGKRYRDLTQKQKDLLWKGVPGDSLFPGIEACFDEMKKWKYKIHIRVFIRRYQNQILCTACHGGRINAHARQVRIGELNLPAFLDLPLGESLVWFKSLSLNETQLKRSSEVYAHILRRLELLHEVGLGYLTLSRLTKTLSGGEFQRVNLASQLGGGLCGTLYVLDEPSIGLHAADTERLLRILRRLRDQGNTVVVVEHDLDVMRNADYLVEIGPGSGSLGGELIAQGPAAELIATPGSLTGKYLGGSLSIPKRKAHRAGTAATLVLQGCREHNLKNITVEFPLKRLVVVTGVSGSGKSTLVHQTLYRALEQRFHPGENTDPIGLHDKLTGGEHLTDVLLLDQTPIGRSSRSNPVTYLKAWDEVRKIYANQALSVRRGYTPQYFSFNVDGGRCPVCKGDGKITLDLHFMAEIEIPCEECDGKRFQKNILEVTFQGKSVDDLLRTSVDEAYELFQHYPILTRKLGLLRDVGLGYLQLGQSGSTLSGGESQRLKVAATLDQRSKGDHLLYIFDEPTTGLHAEDIKRLLTVFHDLVDSGHSVILIEHHLDVIAQADWIIDLGPTGGKEGGQLLAAGPLSRILESSRSITGQCLRGASF